MKRKKIELHPKQSEIYRSPARFKIIRAGRRFGKTFFCVAVLIEKAGRGKGRREYWFVAPFYKQAKEIAWQMLLDMMPKNWTLKKNEVDLSIVLRNGSTIKLKGADNPESLRGVGVAGAILDEYAFMRPYVWEEVIRPMLFDSGGWCIFISTPKGYNHFYDLWKEALGQNDWARFHYTSYDNPYLLREELDKSKAEMSEERFEQEVMAEFTRKSGAVWPMFRRKIHVKKRREPKADAIIVGSIDFGFAVGHPTSVLWHEIDGEYIYTFDGFLEEGRTIEEIDERMKGQVQGLVVRGIYPDPSRPDLIKALTDRGWNCLETQTDVELGITKVAEYMSVNPLTKKPRWTISEHLEDEIRQIEEYEWMEVRGRDGKFRQFPKKENDDCPDALRYFIFSYLKPKKEEAYYHEEYQRQKANKYTGYA